MRYTLPQHRRDSHCATIIAANMVHKLPIPKLGTGLRWNSRWCYDWTGDVTLQFQHFNHWATKTQKKQLSWKWHSKEYCKHLLCCFIPSPEVTLLHAEHVAVCAAWQPEWWTLTWCWCGHIRVGRGRPFHRNKTLSYATSEWNVIFRIYFIGKI